MRTALPALLTTLMACGSTAPHGLGTPDLARVSDLASVDLTAPGVDAALLPDGAVASPDGAVASSDYDVDGPVAVSTFSATVSGGSGFTVTVYLPSTAGPHPVVMLSAGLQQPGAAYATYGRRLASWGIVALLRDDPGVVGSTTTLVADVEYVVGTWLPAQNTTSTSPLFGLVDTTKIALAGHSRGGEVSLLAAEGGAKGQVKALFGLDPVDGTSGTVAITTIGAIGIPLAFIGETTDNASSGCAPAAQSFVALYGAASSPAVAITAVGADHTMFEDAAQCSFCFFCKKGTASQLAVEGRAVRYLMAFFARELLGDTSVGAAFQGAGIGVDVAASDVTIVSK